MIGKKDPKINTELVCQFLVSSKIKSEDNYIWFKKICLKIVSCEREFENHNCTVG